MANLRHRVRNGGKEKTAWAVVEISPGLHKPMLCATKADPSPEAPDPTARQGSIFVRIPSPLPVLDLLILACRNATTHAAMMLFLCTQKFGHSATFRVSWGSKSVDIHNLERTTKKPNELNASSLQPPGVSSGSTSCLLLSYLQLPAGDSQVTYLVIKSGGSAISPPSRQS
jgi:hypothetical protein